MLRKWRKISKLQYLKTFRSIKGKNPLSIQENNMICKILTELKVQKIPITRKQLVKLWLNCKERFIEDIRNGHSRNILLQMFFYWTLLDSPFSRLQINPIGPFKEYLKVLEERINGYQMMLKMEPEKINCFLEGWYRM